MRVLHIITTLEIGGAEVLVSELLTIKEKLPFELYVVSNKTGRLAEKLRNANCGLTFLHEKGFDLRYILKLRRFIIANDIEIIHIHDRRNAIYAIVLNIILNKKTVITIHGFSYGKSILRHIIDRAFHRIVFVSKTLKTAIKNKDDIKYRIVYNGVNPEKFANIAVVPVFASQSPKIVNLGMIGNFKNSARDQLTVCIALKALKERDIPFQFVFVGEKSEKQSHYFDQCYNYCSNNNLLDKVHFLGSRTDIPNILSQLDVFVYSSHFETFCLSVVEAMVSGTAVITNDLPVFKEITADGKYATLYETRNSNDLATKILNYIDNPVPYKEKASLAAVYAIENFSMEKHFQNLNHIYRELLICKQKK